jgi:probable HAF family extracellular repeat protein
MMLAGLAALYGACGAGSAVAAGPPTAGASYSATDLGPGYGEDVNASGLVVGSSASHAVLWDNGTLRDLGTLPAPYDDHSNAVAVNSSGEIAGTSYDLHSNPHAFVWRNGEMTDLGTLGGPSTVAAAINDRGEVVGMSNTTTIAYYHHGVPVYVWHAFLWRDGQMTDLGTPGGQTSVATDINQLGQVAATADAASGPPQAAIWDQGSWTVLGGLAAGDQAGAVAIDDFGQVLGTDDTLGRSLLWTAGQPTDLAASSCPGLAANVMDLNDFGWILGVQPDPGRPTGFGGSWDDPVLCKSGSLTFLPGVPGSANDWPSRMNRVGDVAGFADFEGGAEHAVLWSTRPQQ